MLLPLLMIISITFSLADFTNFGVFGNTYPIKEKSFKVSIQEGITDLNISKIKKEFDEQINTLVIENRYYLPLSKEERSYSIVNKYEVPTNIIGPDGVMQYRQGEILYPVMPANQTLNLCFVDAKYPQVLESIVKSFGECIYFIANSPLSGNYPNILSHSADGKIYPVSDRYVKRFHIEMFPTKIHLEENHIDYKILNMKKLLKENGVEL